MLRLTRLSHMGAAMRSPTRSFGNGGGLSVGDRTGFCRGGA